MNPSAALAADLGLLSAAVQDSGGDLRAWLESFVEDLSKAVDSYLGLTMTVALDDQEISFTLSDAATQAGTSLRIPLAEVADSDRGSAMVLYAATPGALVDLAADLAWALELDLSTLVLDQELAVPAPSDAVIGLRENTTINRAVGVLIDRGHTPLSARTELRHHADGAGGSVLASAQRILDGLRRRPVTEDEI